VMLWIAVEHFAKFCVTLSNKTATLHSSNEMTHFVSMQVAYIAIAQIDKETVGIFDLHYGPWAKPTIANFTGVLWGQHNDLISLLKFLLPGPEIVMCSITLVSCISMTLGEFGSLRQFRS